MKRIYILITLALIISILSGCSFYINLSSSKTVTLEDLSVGYIRTDGYHEEVEYPHVEVIKSKDQLLEYLEKQKDRYNLESDEEPNFNSYIKTYNEVFFKDNIVIMILIQEPSGSIRHDLDLVTNDKKTITFNITREVPEVGTTDMAQWHIIVNMPKPLYSDEAIEITFD